MQNHLLAAYQNAEYRVDGFSRPIYIGEHSMDADRILSHNNLNTWAYITAYNPLSVPLDAQENMRRNEELRALIKDYLVMEGEGQDKAKQWLAEKSFFIAGISLDDAKALAIRFGQKAMVFGQFNQPAELIITLPQD
jgi:hypothetical protein